jgi:hypothetical protein
MAFVEGKGRSVVDGGFQHYGVAGSLEQALLGRRQQLGTKAGAAVFGKHVNGDDVTEATAAGFGDNKAGDLVIFGRAFGNDGKRLAALNVGGQFPPGVGNAGGKALLVDTPENLEILSTKVSQGKRHSVILSGARSGVPQPGDEVRVVKKIPLKELRRAHPEKYHAHLRWMWDACFLSP